VWVGGVYKKGMASLKKKNKKKLSPPPPPQT